MNAWDRSWTIARTSFAIMNQDREMFWFPVLAGLFSVIFAVAMLVPTIVLQLLDDVSGRHVEFGALQLGALFVTYFGLAFITTFFNVCVVYTTKVRLSGGDATFMESIKFALSRIHLIAGWSLVSASVGLLLRLIDELAERSGLAGKIILGILRVILASAWSLMTIFVLPSMVYRELGPIDAIKDSIETLKRTWGESLVRSFGLGLLAFLAYLVAFAIFALGVVVAGSLPPVGIGVIALGVIAIVAVTIVSGLANTVFNTVLYDYATTQRVPAGVDPYLLQGVFARKA